MIYMWRFAVHCQPLFLFTSLSAVRISLELEVTDLAMLAYPLAPGVALSCPVQHDSHSVGDCCSLESLVSSMIFSPL